MKYLKIENKGVCPVEGFTIFGASSKDSCSDKNVIGTFGSGAKHGVSLGMRQGIMPTIYCGNTKLYFYTKPLVIKGVGGEMQHNRLCVKVSGKTEEGKTVNQDKELDHTLNYGSKDWDQIALALREFVSNAIDACYEQGLSHKEVSVEIVDENQVRAKSGYTRIFVPADTEVMKFYCEIDKWFLHFNKNEDINLEILPKSNRNIMISNSSTKNKSAVIYRRGVRIREFMSTNIPSLFDYNIKDLDIDEARTIDDFKAEFFCAQALQKTKDVNVMARLFQAMLAQEECWELQYSHYKLNYNIERMPAENKEAWASTFRSICGDKAVITTSHLANKVAEKGYKPVICSPSQDGIYNFIVSLKIPVDTEILTVHDRNGREIHPATPAVEEAFNFIWDTLSNINMTFDREKPKLFCFKQMSQASSIVFGYWEKDSVYINQDFAQAVTDALLDTMLEECAHHVTKATDGSRDFANYLISVTREMAKKKK